jgi:hypothetical protein
LSRNGAVSFEDFVTTEDDEIYVSILKDSVYKLFDGFVTLEEGNQPIKDDSPYTLTIRATTGLVLLKGVPFTDQAGNLFTGKNTIIKYLTAALSKANNQINVRVWCDIYDASMLDRAVSVFNDPLIQFKVEARSFLSDDETFLDCYEVLRRIVSQHFVVFYHLGTFNILRVADLQRILMHFTEFAPDGVTVIDGGEGDAINAKIGRSENITSIANDNNLSLVYSRKKIKLSYSYEGLKNLPRNKNWRNGSLLLPIGGVDWRAYQVNDWDFGKVVSLATPGGTLVGTTANHYRRINLDAFGYEKESFIVIESNSGEQIWMRAEPIPVHQNDKVSISISFKCTTNLAPGNAFPLRVWLAPSDGAPTRYGLDFSANYPTHTGDGKWQSGLQGVGISYVTGDDSREWHSVTVESQPLPEDGTLYIALECQFNGGFESFYKDFTFEYIPYIDGGYRPVKGDYNKYEQALNIKNVVEEDVFISDSPKKAINGALYNVNGTDLLDPTWYRYGTSELKRYTDLVALGYYNLRYRKFRKIIGSFKGFNYEHRTGEYIPFGLMTKFEFVEMGDGRQYMCVNPRMNLKTGLWSGTMIEVYKDSNDGTQAGTYEFNYIF